MTDAGRRGLLGSMALVALGGCAVPPVSVPMAALRPPGLCAGRAPELVVMLPGAYSRPPEFIDEGFVTLLRARGTAADVLVADAHLGYFHDRSVLTRLREDVILPARELGYARIWLVGISLGGFASLAYGLRHGSEIDGIVALAPFVGSRMLLREIAAAGGPVAWRRAPRAPAPDEQIDALAADVWAWLVDRQGDARRAALPPVYLGWGRDDRFAESLQVAATLFPLDRVTTAAGGHDWPAWRDLWAGWLDRGLLPRIGTGGCA